MRREGMDTASVSCSSRMSSRRSCVAINIGPDGSSVVAQEFASLIHAALGNIGKIDYLDGMHPRVRCTAGIPGASQLLLKGACAVWAKS